MTKRIFFPMIMLIASAFMISCNNTEKTVAKGEISAPAFDLTKAKKEIEEVNQHFMELVAKGDSVGIANLKQKTYGVQLIYWRKKVKYSFI